MSFLCEHFTSKMKNRQANYVKIYYSKNYSSDSHGISPEIRKSKEFQLLRPLQRRETLGRRRCVFTNIIIQICYSLVWFCCSFNKLGVNINSIAQWGSAYLPLGRIQTVLQDSSAPTFMRPDTQSQPLYFCYLSGISEGCKQVKTH